jgi:signal transduction histidine kinase
MATGELKQQVSVHSQDELGELAAAFNQMSADLARANHLRRQMTADIAHDLRTPLTVMTGYLESLRDGVLKPSTARFEVMYNEAQHLQRLVEDLRTLSLTDAGELLLHRQPVAPQALLERGAAAFRHRAERQNVTLQVNTDQGLPEINVDPERMAQVLGNLISNALRYTPEGGQIILSARQQADALVLAVQDSGAGIKPEALAHVFERFYRGDASRQQQDGESGLGLAIARSLVETHGGWITAQSDGIGCGSTFAVYLPL